jgi:hypothetical protein
MIGTAAIPDAIAMAPGRLCSVALLAFGTSFVFAQLVVTVALGGALVALLAGTAVGLSFAAAGGVVFCYTVEFGAERDRTSGATGSAALAVSLVAGCVLGGLL